MSSKNIWGKKDALPCIACEHCDSIIKPRQHIDRSGRNRGWYVPSRFCSVNCANSHHIPERHKWARGWALDKQGYVILNSGKKGGYKQPEHRFVMEQMLGRKLKKHETVHHKNGIRTDNRLENLELWSGRHGRGQRESDLDIWSGTTPSYLLGLSAIGG